MEDDKKERDAKRGERSHKDLQVKAGRSSFGHKTAARSLFSNNKPKPNSGPLDKFLRISKQSLPGSKQEKINKKYAYWLGASGLPVSAITDNPNFKDFIAEINPEVNFPSISTVMKDCMQSSYQDGARKN